MITIREDFEIENSNEDRLGLGKDADTFINKYIESNYKGSVLLSGKWGIGKTSYLRQIEEKTNKDKKFVWLDYWDKNNQTKFYTYLYSKLKPNMYAWHKFNPLLWVIILSAVQFLLVLVQFVISMFKDMQHLPDNNMIIMGLITWFILFVVSGTLTFAKDNYSEENKYKKKLVKYLKKHDVILVFDDFDRIDNEAKDDLFHHLSEVNLFKKSLIIVVGEHNKLIEGTDNVFTQKILNNVEHMPLKTKSISIWGYYVEKEIEELIDTSNKTRSDDFLFSDIREQFVADHRTFREAKQLLNSFEFEYVEIREKKINPSQALAINYIYQFYNQVYEIINNNLDVIYGDDMRLEGSYDHGKIRGNIENILMENNVELPKAIINFIYNVFHNNNGTGFYYPSISERLNYTQYQLGHFETSSVSIETLNNYLQANLNDSSAILAKLTEKDFERLYILIINRIRNKNSDEQEYLSLLNKLIYYKFHGKYGDKNLIFSISYIDSLIYKVKNELSLIHGFVANCQYKEVVLRNNKIDISQKLQLLAVFIPNNSDKEKQEQINLVKKIIQDISWENLISMSKPILVYQFYTVYYKELKNYTDIENELYRVLELEDIKFFKFIYERLVNHITTTSSCKKVEYTKELRVNDVCFNEKFKEAFLNKIDQLDDEKQNIIKDILIK
ncbi:P-loop NTPase fold protein [Staphylococcus succinus]|nr:P-loop NTPase fold protein [Staphylococcus succinus]MDH9160504.1 P-loop NTPase fold protein [Staphylococcus succinus]